MSFKDFEPRHIPNIKVDLYQGETYITTFGQIKQIQFRTWLIDNYEEGYNIRMNPDYYPLFGDGIKEIRVNFNERGEVDRWFPQYELEGIDYLIDVFSETLALTRTLRATQRKFDESKADNDGK
jgi:hypothetical protein